MKLENVKEGDAVAVSEYGNIRKSVAGRCTSTQVTIDGVVFLRRRGVPKGSARWNRTFAEPWRPEHQSQIAEQQEQAQRMKAINTLMDFNYRRLSRSHAVDMVERLKLFGYLDQNK